MSDSTTPTNGSPTPPDGDEPASSRLVAQFVVFPLAIVIVGAALYILLGLLTQEDRAPRDFLNAIRTGGINSRWQAAFELSTQLSNQEAGEIDESFAREIIRVFEASRQDDPRVRRFLAMAMGQVPHPAVVGPPLIDALQDPDSETRIYAALSLGIQGDARALPALEQMAALEDPGLRKAAVFALGEIDAGAALPTLQAALEDPEADIRWNAALQLAKSGNASGLGVLKADMLNRSRLDGIEGMTREQKDRVMVGAIRSLQHLRDLESRPLLEKLKDADPSMQVRQAAIEALSDLQP